MSRFQPKPGFPPAVKEVFDALRQEVTYLHSNWDTFKQLYGTQESVDALNGVAPGAFSLIGLVFRREFITAACRIADQKAFGSGPRAKENLTLKQLLHVVKENGADQAFIDLLTAKEAQIDAHCRPFRERRNRTIGHLDLMTALKTHPTPVPQVDSAQIAQFLAMLAEFMNLLLGHYTDAYADFVPTVHGPARNIVHALKEFKRLQKKEYERELAELRAESRCTVSQSK
jgi:hypothetical protein